MDGEEVLVLKDITIKKYFDFFERDQDITVYDEFHYIYITLKETLNILGTHLINATLLHFRRTFIQS